METIDKIIEFLSHPVMMELLKALFWGCIGAVLAMLLHDMRVDRWMKKEAQKEEETEDE